jgi:hypothetical protein
MTKKFSTKKKHLELIGNLLTYGYPKLGSCTSLEAHSLGDGARADNFLSPYPVSVENRGHVWTKIYQRSVYFCNFADTCCWKCECVGFVD